MAQKKIDPKKAAAQQLKTDFLAKANGVTRGSLVKRAWDQELLSRNELKRLGVTAHHFHAMEQDKAKTGINKGVAQSVLDALTQKYKLG